MEECLEHPWLKDESDIPRAIVGVAFTEAECASDSDGDSDDSPAAGDSDGCGAVNGVNGVSGVNGHGGHNGHNGCNGTNGTHDEKGRRWFFVTAENIGLIKRGRC